MTTILSDVETTSTHSFSVTVPLPLQSRTIAGLLSKTISAVAPGIGISLSGFH